MGPAATADGAADCAACADDRADRASRGVSRKSVFNNRDKVERGGVAELLTRDWAGARTPAVCRAVADEFIARLEAGQFRQARDAQGWIKKRTRSTLSVSGALEAWAGN